LNAPVREAGDGANLDANAREGGESELGAGPEGVSVDAPEMAVFVLIHAAEGDDSR
jgi:hypothetical protein